MKRLITLILLFCIVLLSPIYGKEDEKIIKMWKQIEAVSDTDDQSVLVRTCNELIQYAPWNNEYVFRSRILLSDYYLQQADMVGIYEQYAYLRAYQKTHPDEKLCYEYMTELKDAYDNLVEFDKQKPIQEGFYFSTAFNKSGIPLLAFEIKQVGDSYLATIHPVCEFAKLMDMYKTNGEPSYKTNAQSDITVDENGIFTAQWGFDKIHHADINSAKAWMEGGEEFRANMYGDIAKSDMSLGQTVVASIATEVVGSIIFDGISSLFASSKVIAHVLGVKWDMESPGILKARIDFFLETQKTGNYPKRKNIHYSMRMYKIYPHYELLFRNNGQYLTYKDERNNKKLEKTNAVFFDDNTKCYWFDYSKHNKTMYARFALNTVFKPLVNDHQPDIQIPSLEDLKINNDADGNLFYLAGYNKKQKCNDYFAAVLYDNGRITIGEMVKGRYNGKFLEFNPDGSYHNLIMANGVMNGRCIIRHPNGTIFFDGNYSNGERDGYGVESCLDGTVYKGMWKSGRKSGEGSLTYPDKRGFLGEFYDDVPWNGSGTLKRDSCMFTGTLVDGLFNGDCIIEYPNGDTYNGQVKSNLPNGLGTMTYADIKKRPRILKTTWTEGLPAKTTLKSSVRKKKGTRK